MGIFESNARYGARYDQCEIVMTMLTLKEIKLDDQRVLIRVDLNVPLQEGKILNDFRIRAILPTLEYCLKKNARIILISHLGRPAEGEYTAAFSLKPIAVRLAELIKQPVRFVPDWLGGVAVAKKEIVLCENVRFNLGEEKNDAKLAKRMAALCDVFVMDAFATAHRAQASTVGVAQFAPIVVAGPLLIAELNALHHVLDNPKRPLVAIVGGSKVSGKLQILKTLIPRVDTLIVGGGIANTFLAAIGQPIGDSLHEPSLIPVAKELIEFARGRGVNVIMPSDAIVATGLLETDFKHPIIHFRDIKKKRENLRHI